MQKLITEAPRIPRKPGQPAGSDKHSDLYTDENPKGTIKGLKFATVDDAKASINKIKNSGKTHAHKIQAAVAIEQRARVAGKKTAAGVYRKFINAMKEKTKKMKESPEIGGVKMKKLGSNPGSYKRLVKKHLGKSSDKKITKSDGDKIIAIAKKKGDKELARKGSFIKNVIAEGALDRSGQPQYGKGIGGKDEKRQAAAFKRNVKRYKKNPDNPKSFEPTALDKQIMKKRKAGKMKPAPKSRYSEMNENQKALANKAKESGEPLGVLKKVYKRGLAAYASGHRPGMTQHQWAMARVNSYIKGGKARTVDKDLREMKTFKQFINEQISAKDSLKNWRNEDARLYAEAMIKKFGQPDEVTETRLLWNAIEPPFDKNWIIDESIPHDFPKPHRDYVYSSMMIPLKTDMMESLSHASGSIIYDGLTKMVTARCGSLYANASTLGFVKKLAEGEIPYKNKDAVKQAYANAIKKDPLPEWYPNTMGE